LGLKQLGFAVLFALSGVATATAADLSRIVAKAPALTDPAYRWGGWYMGGQAGGVWGSSTVDSAVVGNATAMPQLSPNGFAGGGQIGYNHQVDRWLFGVEADATYTGLRQTRSVTGPFPAGGAFTATGSLTSDWMATLRPRAGYTVDRTLFYLTGGLALTDLSFASAYTDTAGASGGASFSTTKVGWVAGAGIEHALGKNWSAKVEYLYADFGKQSAASPLATAPGTTNGLISQDIDLKTNTLRGGINYHFGGPAGSRY
jgi:outer membrane immunogenic protein